jgi:acetyl-CoA carboxylase biotin carboxylase subunit
MRRALGEYVVAGIKTNIPFHLALFSHPDFVRGDYDTSFIATNKSTLHTAGDAGDAEGALAIGAAIGQAFDEREATHRPSNGASGGEGGGLSAWRLGAVSRLR